MQNTFRDIDLIYALVQNCLLGVCLYLLYLCVDLLQQRRLLVLEEDTRRGAHEHVQHADDADAGDAHRRIGVRQRLLDTAQHRLYVHPARQTRQ